MATVLKEKDNGRACNAEKNPQSTGLKIPASFALRRKSLQPCDAVQRAIVHSLFGLKGREFQQWLQGLEHFVRFSRWRAGAWSPPLKKWDMHFRWVLSPANRITLRSVAAGHRTTTTNDARRMT